MASGAVFGAGTGLVVAGPVGLVVGGIVGWYWGSPFWGPPVNPRACWIDNYWHRHCRYYGGHYYWPDTRSPMPIMSATVQPCPAEQRLCEKPISRGPPLAHAASPAAPLASLAHERTNREHTAAGVKPEWTSFALSSRQNLQSAEN